MNKRSGKVIVAGVVASALTLLPAAGASAGRIGDAPRLQTSSPDLRSVEVRSVDLNDDEREFVNFCFDENLQEASLTAAAFGLQGYNSEIVVVAETADLSTNNQRCVQAGFTADTDVRQFTIGFVENGAAADVQRNENVQSSEELRGSNVTRERGRTSAPDLVDTQTNETQNRVGFLFDEQLEEATTIPGGPAAFDPAQFGFYQANGDESRGTSVVSVESKKVTIQFAETDQVNEAVRFFTDEAAVADQTGEVSPVGSEGGNTADPDLIAAERVSRTEVEFSFSEGVQDVDPASFLVYAEDATAFAGTSFSKVGSKQVRVSFRQIRDFSKQTVGVAALRGAVTSQDVGNEPNTVGYEAIGKAKSVPGKTDGPDLARAVYRSGPEQVVFIFDEKVNDDSDSLGESFFIIDRSGNLTPGLEVINVDGKRVVINFGSDVSTAKGASVDAGAVEDFQTAPTGSNDSGSGNRNPVATVGR